MSFSRRSLLIGFGASSVVGSARSLASSSIRAVVAPKDVSHNPLLLDRNENPYGPSERALAAVRDAVPFSSRYPRDEYDLLVAKIAAQHAVKPDQVVVGCGSSEILRLAASIFLTRGKKLVQASPTCPALGDFASSAGVEVIPVPLTIRFEHDLDTMLVRAGSSAGLIYICNPNNPTGSLTPRKDIEAFISKLRANTPVLIDEAYHHYVSPNGSYASFLDQPMDDPRVMVVRTFSKVYGLAGMRVGYIVAAPDTARRFSTGRLKFGVSVVSLKAAAAALDDAEYVRLGIQRNADDRQDFMNQLNIRMLRGLNSHTNFVMMNPLRPSIQVIEHLKKNNILIGPIFPSMDKFIRISFGTPATMEEFWKAWDLMPPTGKMAM
jgi:histidinol-phosphate aminotransferase